MGKALELPESLRISILESLCHVTSRDDRNGELLGLCPVHGEKNASFSYNYKTDVYFCQSCKASGDLIKLWILVRGFSNLKEGFVSFCREYGLGDEKANVHIPDKKKEAPKPSARKKPQKDLGDIFRQMPPLPDAWIRELKRTRGWSEEIIRKYDLRLQTLYKAKEGPVKNITWKPNKIVIPIHDESGKIVNMRIYRPGPAINEKDPKIFSWEFGTGEARLFPAKPQEDGFILLCEGEPDDLCALSMGYNAITQTSKPKNWSKEHLDKFRGRDVVIAFDADLAGQTYMTEFAIPELEKVARSIKCIEWPDFMGRLDNGKWPNDHGQDLTDFFVRHGRSKADLDELISSAKVYKAEDSEEDYAEEDIDSQAFDFFVRGVNDRLSFKARRLAERLCEMIPLLSDPESGLLYRWNKRCWEQYHEDHLKKTAIKLLGEESQTSRVNDSVNQARVLSTISEGRAVNDMPEWLCLKNGMLNIKTLELVPHDPGFYATVELPVEYNPESESICKLWLKFLETNIQTPEVIAQVQEFFGYCLYRRTHIAKCLLLLGPGSDGKSTMLSVLRELVGVANCASVGFEDLDDNFMRASLYNKSVNISTEIGSKAIDSPYFKAITSGDPISASFKFKDNFEFKPFCKLVFAANKLPRSLDNSDGYFRRILPIQFKRQFFENDPDTDPFLEGKLISELSEIFHWALVGLHRLLDKGKFTDSDETQAILLGYRRLNNPVVCFLDECCEFNDGLSVKKADVYEAYKKFCNMSGYSAFSKENFFREMYAAKHNLQVIRKRLGDKREFYISGLGLTSLEAAA